MAVSKVVSSLWGWLVCLLVWGTLWLEYAQRLILFGVFVPILCGLLYWYMTWDWIFLCNFYVVSIHLLFAANPVHSEQLLSGIADTVILFNLRGIQNVEYHGSVGGVIWIVVACCWSMGFWAYLMWKFVQQLPAIQRIVPEYPTGHVRKPTKGVGMTLPTEFKWKK